MISQLSQRDRVALIVGGAVVLIVLIIFGGILPFQDALSRLDTKIAARERQLRQVETLRSQFLAVQRQLRDADRRLDASRSFSLFSFIEGITSQVASKENLVYMRPQPASSQDGYQENSVEIKLEKIRLDQLVRLLYDIQNADAYLQVKNMRVKTRFDDRTLLDVVLTVSAYGRSS
ncbi:MAG TPA: type II secretion system protein GspM [Desulfuromonadales bacterium]|nr:type II secretion system protein GspM [Desulfuromonadales bacterium]